MARAKDGATKATIAQFRILMSLFQDSGRNGQTSYRIESIEMKQTKYKLDKGSHIKCERVEEEEEE